MSDEPSAVATRQLRVLHLEDSARDAELVRHKLDEDGVACNIFVVSGKDSYEAALEHEPFDLIISDYNLPGYDGIAALKQARQTQPDVPVILISGTVGEEDAVKCLQVGATDYLLKRRLERLGPAVHRAIQEAETRRTRKRIEAALGESELRKAAVLDSVLDCIVTMDGQGTVLEFNAAAVRTFGYSKAAAIGRPLADLIIPPEFRERHRAELARYMATGESALIGRLLEMTAVRADGSEIPVEVTITPVHLGSSSIFTGVLRDITLRKQADAAQASLAAVLAEQAELLDLAEDAIIVRSMDNRIQFWNRGAEVMYGWARQEVLGRNTEHLLTTEFSEPDEQIKATLLRDGRWEGEVTHQKRDGTRVHGASRSTLERDADGVPVRILTIINDITTRKQTEAERLLLVGDLQRSTTALRESEERTNYALDAGRMGVWELDLATHRITWSETMAAMYGLAPEQSPKSVEAFLAMIHAEDRPAFEASLAAAVAEGADFTAEFRVMWPDETVHWNSGRARVLRDVHGVPTRVLGVGADISDRKSLEAQFRQSQKMEAVGQLAGGLAHDFNNMLTAILGYSSFVLETMGPQDARRADMEEVIKSGQRAAALTRQLLAFSRKQILQPTSVSLNALVNGIRPMLSRLIGEHVELVSLLAPDACAVRADPGQLEQVIMNLVVNARDAMPTGGRVTVETATVTLDESFKHDVVVQPGPYVMLAVSDSGTGIDEQTKRRLFEPFFTTKEPGKGTGLGLATVYGIVTQSGGYIAVDSEPGHGATFKVYLPCSGRAAVVEEPGVRDEPIATAIETVLLVEDEDGVRLLTRRILERGGYRVFDAPNPQLAEELFRKNATTIDMLVTDVIMPGSSGPKLFERLARLRHDLKVLYVSGYADDTIVHQGQLDPGIAFLQKPFTAEALNRRIREVLDRR